MSSETSPATTWSLAFLLQLVELGVQHIVVSPGSRSQALALAADQLSQYDDSELQGHVCIDERTAGFFGLGLAVETGQPTVLLCTSGSAPAHYLPALLEAKHSGIPIIALTADRPQELQGVGANQTTEQVGILGNAVHRCMDVPAPRDAEGLDEQAFQHAREIVHSARNGAPCGRAGPVQLNIAFRDPLSSPITAAEIGALEQSVRRTKPQAVSSYEPRQITLDPAPGTVVIAGHGAGPEAEELAQRLGAVLIAEVHSGTRFGPNAIVAYRQLLDAPTAGQTVRRVVCVGRPTLSRQTQQLLSRVDIEHVVWQRNEPEPSNLSGSARIADHLLTSRPATTAETRDWVAPWVMASREFVEADSSRLDPPAPEVEAATPENAPNRAGFAEHEMAVVRRPVSRRDIAREVWDHTWPGDQLVLGSSRMIREFDTAVPGKKIPVWANRGLSGIDGTVATARGVAAGRVSAGLSGVTRVVLGDLALLHDANSLLLQDSERERSRLQILVVNDGGGSLFDSLEVARSADKAAFERVIFTPAGANYESLASAYGWSYRRATDLGGLVEALADTSGQVLIECPVAREAL